MSTIQWQGPGGTTNSPTSGDFDTASNWQGGTEPGDQDTAVLSGTSSYTVSVDGQSSPTIAALIVGANTTLDMQGYLSITTQLENSGAITVDHSNGYGVLEVGGTVLSGGGTIDLIDATIDGYGAEVYSEKNNTIENQNETIDGSGKILASDLLNDANGIINCDVSYDRQESSGGLFFQTSIIVNSGLMEATDDNGDAGYLDISGPVTNYDASTSTAGTIAAYEDAEVVIDGSVFGGNVGAHNIGTLYVASDGSLLETSLSITGQAAGVFDGAVSDSTITVDPTASAILDGTISGGSLTSTGTSNISVETATLDGSSSELTVAANMTVGAGNALSLLGEITDSGTITLNGGNAPSDLLIVGNAELDGGGIIQLSDGGTNVIEGSGSAELVNDNETITGNGTLGSAQFQLDNGGTVDATGGSPLFVELLGSSKSSAASYSDNTGTLEATGGGDLEFLRGAITNDGTFSAVGTGSTFDMGKFAFVSNDSAGTLTGGTWVAALGGVLAITGGAVTTDAATITFNGAGSVFEAGNGTSFTTLQQSLTTIAAAGTLGVLGGFGYTTTNAIALAGALSVALGGTFTSGLVTAASGSTISLFGGTIASSLTDAGSVKIGSNGTGTFTGASDTFSGAITGSGFGTVYFTAGSDTLAKGASLGVRTTAITGATVTLGTSLTDTGGLALSSGTLALGGYTLALAGPSTLSGGTVTGAATGAPGVGVLQTKGATTLSGLTLSGSTLSNFGALAQTGTLSLAGASGVKDAEVNQKGATWTLGDNAALTLTGAATDTFSNIGTLKKATGTGKAVVGVAVSNTGTIGATSGTLDLAGAVSGTGTETIGAAGILELGKAIAATQALTFSGVGGHLLLDDAHDFHAGVTGFAKGDAMDLGGFGSSGETYTYTPSGSGTASGGTLAITSGASTASIALHGSYTSNLFHLASDGHGGTSLTYG